MMDIYSISVKEGFGYLGSVSLDSTVAIKKAILENKLKNIDVSKIQKIKRKEEGDITSLEISSLAIAVNTTKISLFNNLPNTFLSLPDINYCLMLPKVIDALIKEKSEILYFKNSSRIMAINKFYFDTTKLKDVFLFVLPYGPTTVFVTDRLVNMFNQNKLTGLDYKLIFKEKV